MSNKILPFYIDTIVSIHTHHLFHQIIILILSLFWDKGKKHNNEN